MATIDQFKAQLIGGGPRANRFRVFVPRSGQNIELLATATSMPASTVAEITIPFRGMNLKLLVTEHLMHGQLVSLMILSSLQELP